MDGGTRVDDTPMHQALWEALTNCLVNADYYGRQGLVIIKKRNAITMSNPGSFRIEIDAVKSGGISDPRNGTMLKMFNLIDIGERAGSGIPNIFRVWREQGWTERSCHYRYSKKKVAIKSSNKGAKTAAQKIAILEYLPIMFLQSARTFPKCLVLKTHAQDGYSVR